MSFYIFTQVVRDPSLNITVCCFMYSVQVYRKSTRLYEKIILAPRIFEQALFATDRFKSILRFPRGMRRVFQNKTYRSSAIRPDYIIHYMCRSSTAQ